MSPDHLSRTIREALAAAGLPRHVSPSVLDTIDRALASAGLAGAVPAGADPGAPGSVATADGRGAVVDVESRWVDDAPAAAADPAPATSPSPPRARPASGRGRFTSHEYAGPGGKRSYKLFAPAGHAEAAPLPLVVMLHGCKQDPDDFARGTRMNELAQELGFLVAYPAQSRKANGSNCWRWFEAEQQQRDGAEPSIIAGIVRELLSTQPVDPRRVYVAGLSAGAAMAVILGQTCPDLFAAVAAHSGLPRGAAHDVGSAFAAMGAGAAAAPAQAVRAVPTIVFHGEADATVVPANGSAIVAQAVGAFARQRGPLAATAESFNAQGRRGLRTSHRDAAGELLVEHWSVQGAGHAWFGGSPAGSYAVPDGPDASREALRFFLAHRRHVAN